MVGKFEEIEVTTKIQDALGMSWIVAHDLLKPLEPESAFGSKNIENCFKGDEVTGPYLQFVYASLPRVRTTDLNYSGLEQADFAWLMDSMELDIVTCLAQYPDVTSSTSRDFAFHRMVLFLGKLARMCESVLVGSPYRPEFNAKYIARAALWEAARQVLHNGMTLLGMTPIEIPLIRSVLPRSIIRKLLINFALGPELGLFHQLVALPHLHAAVLMFILDKE